MKLRKFFVLSLVLVFVLINFLHFGASQEILFNYPSEVCIDEEFNVQLTLVNFSSDIYDVKIDVTNSSNKTISKIYNGNEWKSTYYYLNDIISNNEQKTFLLKIIYDFDEAYITVKIKSSAGYIVTFTGYNISKKNSCSTPPNNSTNSTNNSSSTNSTNQTLLTNFTKLGSENSSSSKNYTSSDKENFSINSFESTSSELSPISLNAKNIKTQENSNLENKSKNKYAIYLLLTFCILLLFLFLLKKKKYRKNEFN
jgi:hypothetical protein